MKFMIHLTPKRKWYVDKYLVPSMLEQGISKEDIIYWNDDKGYGNLTSWVKSCEWCNNNLDMYDGTWHLQDDIVICREFKKRCEELANQNDIICGFFEKSTLKQQPFKFGGRKTPKEMCNSFQCIYIPNYLLKMFPMWFDDKVSGTYYKVNKNGDIRCDAVGVYETSKLGYAKLNKNDDAIFNRYLREKYPNQFVYNLEKPLVQHIDYLLGGSLLYDRKSVYETTNFDKDVVKEIEEKLKNEVYDT